MMITKNTNKIKEAFNFNNIVDTFSLANNFALATTENVAIKGIKTVGEWQKYTDKAIKNGLKYNAKKQEFIFDALDSGKVVLVKNISKVIKRFSKK